MSVSDCDQRCRSHAKGCGGDGDCGDVGVWFPVLDTSRFNELIVSASGILRAEGRERAKAPIAAVEEGLRSTRQATRGLRWNPIADFTEADVQASHARYGFACNETYACGMSRHSCKFCIMAALPDLLTAVQQHENHDLYRELVEGVELSVSFPPGQDDRLRIS